MVSKARAHPPLYTKDIAWEYDETNIGLVFSST